MSDVSDGEIVDEAVLSGKPAAQSAAADANGTAAAPQIQTNGVAGAEPAGQQRQQRQPSGSPPSPTEEDDFFWVDPHDPGGVLSCAALHLLLCTLGSSGIAGHSCATCQGLPSAVTETSCSRTIAQHFDSHSLSLSIRPASRCWRQRWRRFEVHSSLSKQQS